MSDTVVEVTWKAQFDALVTSPDHAGKVVFVDFRAAWCGPCRMLGPVLHDLADKHADKMLVVKVDVDNPANQELAMAFAVRSIPQVTLFKDGKAIDQFIGALPPDQVEAYLTKHSA